MEIGWRLARPAWHHGYAAEAARTALDVAFGSLEMAETYSMTAALNEPSQAVTGGPAAEWMIIMSSSS